MHHGQRDQGASLQIGRSVRVVESLCKHLPRSAEVFFENLSPDNDARAITPDRNFIAKRLKGGVLVPNEHCFLFARHQIDPVKEREIMVTSVQSTRRPHCFKMGFRLAPTKKSHFLSLIVKNSGIPQAQFHSSAPKQMNLHMYYYKIYLLSICPASVIIVANE